MKRKLVQSVFLFLATLCLIGGAGLAINHFNGIQETVQVVSERVLVPGGQSVGIKMNVKGVLVVGLEEIETDDAVVSPGYDAGLQIGDTITEINGNAVSYAKDVTEIVNNNGSKNLELKIMRKEKIEKIKLHPVRERTSQTYKIGVWVKEKIAGIGTLTFFDPRCNVFASLGHGIYEMQTGTLLEAGDGQLLRTEVRSIKEGTIGKPGEIRGIFYGDEKPVGQVKKNSVFGVYAKGTNASQMDLTEPIIMGRQEQVEEGDAYILTTIDGKKVERFDIRITKVNRQNVPDSKGMEIEVTDDKLLRYCGGIVQGMSGSPIIQNNRLVGAVTHVFVNNPTRGYGIFAEWMVEESENLK